MRAVSRYFFICLILIIASSTPAIASRTITDQLGRTVSVPDTVQRVVVLQHQALDVMIQLGTQDTVVGVLEKWDKYLPGAAKCMKNIKDMPTPGGLSSVNMEALLSLNPDLVIVTHYAPEEMIDRISKAGIPAVALSFYDASREQASKLNADLKNADMAYNKGVDDAVSILGKIFHKEDRAEQLIAEIHKSRVLLKSHLGNIPEKDRIRCYMGRATMHTYGRGKYTSVIMERAGGVNVAAKDIVGFKEVTMEDVLRWNPQVIFVQWRHRKAAEVIRNNPAWAGVDAVENNKIYVCPEYVKPWGHALPESMALGEIWMAKKLYPEKFKDVDINSMAQKYYRKFYGISYEK